MNQSKLMGAAVAAAFFVTLSPAAVEAGHRSHGLSHHTVKRVHVAAPRAHFVRKPLRIRHMYSLHSVTAWPCGRERHQVEPLS